MLAQAAVTFFLTVLHLKYMFLIFIQNYYLSLNDILLMWWKIADCWKTIIAGPLDTTQEQNKIMEREKKEN